MNRKNYGTLTFKPLDIEPSEMARQSAALAAIQPAISYTPSQFYWRKAAREANDPVTLRGMIFQLVDSLENANRSILSCGWLPGKVCYAPGEKPINSYEEDLARQGYYANGASLHIRA